MKHRLVIGFLFLMLSASAQPKDSLLRRINAIKMDSEHYLYGLSTHPGETNQDVSRQEATRELREMMNLYFSESGFSFLKDAPAVPDSAIHHICCPLSSDCYRSLAYIPKASLDALEAAFHAIAEDDVHRAAIDSLVTGIVHAQDVQVLLDQVLPLFQSRVPFRFGQQFDNQTQALADKGFLIYFDRKTGVIKEIMTPRDPSGNRTDARTGRPADPLQYRSAPIWVFIESLNP